MIKQKTNSYVIHQMVISDIEKSKVFKDYKKYWEYGKILCHSDVTFDQRPEGSR